jgi:hypothetical protein
MTYLADYRFNVPAAESQQQLVFSLGSEARKAERKRLGMSRFSEPQP